ncbi:hypothetical protein XELAEV_18046417mg [Xenopus laevis]|uniref:Protein sidekick-2 n=1 Tax=Xenopus laevis TaxID=8355 RepID=A0A974BT78_XENLA|nr:hypothetical protein XELAEV_18046417mg [Xenopus laevis]
MECVANARPLTKLNIVWKKNGVHLTNGVTEFGRCLTILNPVLSDAGYYSCEATLRSSSVPPVSAGAYLTVLEPPQFVKEPDRHLTAEIEKVVEIPCQAKGVPQPVISWYKDAVLIDIRRDARFRLVSSGSLKISGLIPEDTGMFQCFARNDAGEVQTSTYLAVTSIAPNITRAPQDSTVIDGTAVVLQCETSGAPRPAITWQKGDRILASGSIQLPRFTLLESGSLLINPAHISDSGTYTCTATNSRGADDASADIIVWARTRITNPPSDQNIIKGTKASMSCGVSHDVNVAIRQLPHAPENTVAMLSSVESRAINLTWAKPFDGNSPLLRYILEVSENKAPWTILLGSVDPEQTALVVRNLIPARSYQFRLCASNDVGKGQFSKDTERVTLPEEPPSAPPQNVIASGRTNQSIMIQWQPPPENHQNGILKGYVVRYCLSGLPVGYQYQNLSSPDNSHLLLEDLIIWTNYEIEVAAYNSAGLGVFSGKVTEWTLQGVPTVPPENVKAEAVNSTAIRFTWNPPSPQFVNGIKQGYKVHFEHPQNRSIRTFEGFFVRFERLKDFHRSIEGFSFESNGRGILIVRTNGNRSNEWKSFDFSGRMVANSNCERSQPFANIRRTRTVEVRANKFAGELFATSLVDTQRLLGLMVWEPDQEDDIIMVTVRPKFQENTHVGVISGLKKFTSYFTSILCFTSPGDGPRSTPQLLWTNEDVPGPVGHLSFDDILDTSLRVTWQEPDEKNGLLSGYKISWEEFNQTNTRVTHYLPNVTLEYRVTGLTSLTTYTIQVAGMTSKGQGAVSSSTISSGVPPELPGAPSYLGISNIGSRSVTLQFRPGYDGKTSISKWLVEAQVGSPSESDDWVLIYELANEPNARSLNVPELRPYNYYSFRMRQVNIVGSSPPSLPSRRIQTLQSSPSMFPANVTLRTASQTSLWVRWVPLPEMEYNGNPDSVGYKIRYTRQDKKSKPLIHAIYDRIEREYTIEDLEEWTEYAVQIQAFNAIGAGPWSPVATARTRESVPSSGPTNVSALATTSSSILVRWSEIPEPERNGLILGYKVLYKEKDSDTSTHFWLVEGNSSRSVQLSGLGKYVLYEIQVLAFTRIGDGAASTPAILERTLDDVPGPPVGILFPEVRTTSVRLIWQPPAAPNGIILAYQITHRLNATNANTATVEVLNPSVRQYTATGLRPESIYLFRITAQTRKGWGEAAEALVVTTEKRDRPQPPSKPTVLQEDVKARTVLLSWDPGSDGLSPVRYYTIQTQELPKGKWMVHSATISHNATSAIVDRLKPFTSYKFRVKATNDIGDSEYSDESEALTTLQAAPDEAPTMLSVTPHTTTSVLIRWQAPAEDKINGILLGFCIRFRELAYDGLRSFTMQSINNPSAKWAELTASYMMRNLSEPTLTQYELDNLNKHKRYEIRVSMYNAAGEGPSSVPQEVFVGEAVPTAPPQNVVIASATAVQLDVTWEPPPLEAQNGDIQGYKIFYWEVLRKNETEKVRTLFLPETGVKLKNLTGYTTYMISVAAFNAAGDGPRGQPIRSQTLQAAPSAPASIRFSELTTTSVNVSWDAPVYPNGILEGYRLVYEPCTPVDGISKIVTVDVKGNSPLWMKVKDLAEGVTYRFRIQAKTFTYGPDIEANVTTGPGEGAPGPPGEPFISRYSSVITIHWSSGDPGKSPITRYIIEARPSDEGLWDILIKDIPKEATSYTFSIDILKQGVSYDFRVIAVNDYGYGTPSAPSPAVSGIVQQKVNKKETEIAISTKHAQKANPFYEEWWFLVVIALIGLIFILLLVFALIIRGQSKKYAKKSDSACNPKTNTLGHAEMVSLDESRFPALELNNRRLSVKNSFCRKNGIYTRSPPRPSPGSLHYSDEDVTKYNDLIPTESGSLTEKPSEVSDSQRTHGHSFELGGRKFCCKMKIGSLKVAIDTQILSYEWMIRRIFGSCVAFADIFLPAEIGRLVDRSGLILTRPIPPEPMAHRNRITPDIAMLVNVFFFFVKIGHQRDITSGFEFPLGQKGSDSEYEVEQNQQKTHSFVNHYISDPTYYNSWRRQQKGISRSHAYNYSENDPEDSDQCIIPNSNSSQQGSLYRPKSSRTPTPQQSHSLPSQNPIYRPPSSLAPAARPPIAGFSSFV